MRITTSAVKSIVVALSVLVVTACPGVGQERKPNFVVMVMDNLG